MPPQTRAVPRRRLLSTAAWAIALLLGIAVLTACDPSASEGCRRATSSFLVADSSRPGLGHAGTLTGPFSPQLKPAREDRRYNCSRQESPVWQKLKPYRGSVKTNGKKRRSARFYEWDSTHNDIEEYGPAPKYQHLGSIDPIDGDQYKGAVKGRNLRGKLK